MPLRIRRSLLCRRQIIIRNRQISGKCLIKFSVRQIIQDQASQPFPCICRKCFLRRAESHQPPVALCHTDCQHHAATVAVRSQVILGKDPSLPVLNISPAKIRCSHNVDPCAVYFEQAPAF